MSALELFQELKTKYQTGDLKIYLEELVKFLQNIDTKDAVENIELFNTYPNFEMIDFQETLVKEISKNFFGQFLPDYQRNGYPKRLLNNKRGIKYIFNEYTYFRIISTAKKMNYEYLSNNLDLEWDWDIISKNYAFDNKNNYYPNLKSKLIVNKFFENEKTEFKDLIDFPEYIDGYEIFSKDYFNDKSSIMEFVRKFPSKNWNWVNLTHRKDFTYDDWVLMSKNTDLNTIIKHMYRDPEDGYQNGRFNKEFIRDHFDDYNWFQHC